MMSIGTGCLLGQGVYWYRMSASVACLLAHNIHSYMLLAGTWVDQNTGVLVWILICKTGLKI